MHRGLSNDNFGFNYLHSAIILRTNRCGYSDLRIPNGADPVEYTLLYQESGLTYIAELNTYGKFTSSIPDDSLFLQQWGLQKLDMQDAWALEQGKSSVIIAILDAGTDWTHRDLGMGAENYQNIWLNAGEDPWSDPNNPSTGNGLDDDYNGHVDDWKGWNFLSNNNDSRGSYDHGTCIAGIIAAKTNNHSGIAGIVGGWGTPGVRLMIVQLGNGNGLSSSIVDDAIYYAVDNGAKIINMSFTMSFTMDTTHQEINNALTYARDSMGVLLLFASGNDNAYVNCPFNSLVCRPEIVAVGATDQSDHLCQFSNIGNFMDISAPGQTLSILTTTFNDGYRLFGGTSAAVPHIAGIAGLLLSANPNLSVDEVEQILYKTADKVGPYNYYYDSTKPGHSKELGYGRANAYKALASLCIWPPINLTISTKKMSSNTAHPQLTWRAIPAACVDEYKVYRKYYGGGDYSYLATVTVPETMFVDYDTYILSGGPDTNRMACYYVTAVYDNSESDSSNNVAISPAESVDIPEKPIVKIEKKPTVYELSLNYPNPFNPTTNIHYALPEDSYVVLKIFNVLGQEISTPIHESKQAGWYELKFDASNLPSGIYYYRLQAGKFVAVKKMLLAK